LTCLSNLCVRVPDAGQPDLGTPDASTPDAPVPDAPIPDAPIPDAPAPDGPAADGTSDMDDDAGATDAAPDAKPCQTNADCDDALTCTTDICGVGGCTYVINGNYCVIDQACVADGAFDPNNECRKCDALTNQYGWTDDDGTSCDDLAACTHTDTCTAGSCQGTPYTCDDGAGCTTDSCKGTGPAPAGCDFVLQTGFCLIGGQCYADGSQNPSGPGQCVTANELYQWSHPPVLTQLMPADGHAGGTTAVVIIGENFQAGAVVYIDGGAGAIMPTVTVLSQVSLSFSMPPNPYGAPNYDTPYKASVTVGINTMMSNAKDFQYTVSLAMDALFIGSVLTASTASYAGFASDPIEGRVYAEGITDTTTGSSGTITAQIGYGPEGVNPYSASGFVWHDASFSKDDGTYDVYTGSLTVPLSKTYDVAFRFSQDGGQTWIYADTDEAVLAYETSKAAKLTATTAPSNYCQTDSDCSLNAYTVICKVELNPAQNQCVECLTSTDCTGHPTALGPTCNTSQGRCTCSSDGECTNNPNGAACLSTYCGCSSDADCVSSLNCTQIPSGLQICQ
jgi:hypothetical protein